VDAHADRGRAMTAPPTTHDLTWRTDAYAPLEDYVYLADDPLAWVSADCELAVGDHRAGGDVVPVVDRRVDLHRGPRAGDAGLPTAAASVSHRDSVIVGDHRIIDHGDDATAERVAVLDPGDAALPGSPAVVPLSDLHTEIITLVSDAHAAALAPPRPAPDAEQLAALAVMRDAAFADVSGTAGVGKTFLAKLFAEEVPGVALASTTGIAAVNLGEGTTINGLLGYYNTESLREMFLTGQLGAKLRKLRSAGLRKILLDEKSMLSGHQLTYLVRAIDEINQGRTLDDVGMDNEESQQDAPPQMGLVLVGDFGQLPPVKEAFAFESAEWDRFAQHRVSLKTIHRQTDLDFIRALHYVREGRIMDALTWFSEDKFSPTSDDRFDGTTIFAKNDSVDRYNQLRLDQERGRSVWFKSTRWGKQLPDWKQIPEKFELKIGTLVMILANRREPGDEDGPGRILYANGDLGVVTDVQGEGEGQTVFVTLKRNGALVRVVPIVREAKEPLEPGRRKELRDQHKDHLIDGKYEIVGTVTYMPLRLAYGTTVHKSQGLTLDNVQINIGDHFFGKPSMLFVALSRARTPQGLRIVGSQRTFVSRCATDPQVTPWL
jgi:ATP-dependent DNA helicase PIF1